jgi:tetratricopeptide (TPR) repeat protein
MSKSRVLLILFLTLIVSFPLRAQERGGRPPVNREQMWPAPTAEDWAKPCLITFQRTWADALAVSKETGKPILACINMDGEIASEHYAGVRYRQPEIAALYEPYVTVIASTYRHNPRDYDDEGNRILCPRFGSVTCGEHIAMEPILYEKYLDGERVAPRHIMIELDGTETYDVYYANDTASVFEAIRQGIAKRTAKPKTVIRGDRPIVERVASPDINDRIAVENAYREGNPALRAALLEAAAKQGARAPLDLLRLAIFGLDVEAGQAARQALARSNATGATDLISDALRVPMDDSDRDALIAALARIGESSPRAKWLSVVFAGLTGDSGAIDLQAWSKLSREYVAPARPADLAELETRQRSFGGTYSARPMDADASIELAEASLALALKARKEEGYGIRMAQMVARHMFEDARIAGERAEQLKGTPYRVDTVLALAAYYRGDLDTAYARAEKAVKALPPGDPSWNAMAVLTVFAEGRFKAIKKAAKADEKWPPMWLTDLEAAYTALLHHPMGTDGQVLWHYDLLEWLGVKDRATRVVRAGIERFPGSPALHQRLRMSLLRTKGVRELQAVYAEMLKDEFPSSDLLWFGGYASVVAADYYRRTGRLERANKAYDLAIERYEAATAANPVWSEATDGIVALALAAKARMAFEVGDEKAALDYLVRSFGRSPGSAGTADDLGITPASTAQMLMARLTESGQTDLIATLETAMGKLDPALLLPKEE